MPKTRWGIIGTGGIAKSFASDLPYLADAELVAVGSRSQETADAFGDAFNVPRRYSTYEALVADAEVDAIYISTPHPFHKDNALLCIDAGKAVLCEKPFTINAAELEAVITRAREKGVFLMEAMWTRYIPAIVKLRELISEGVIGDAQQVVADFGFKIDVQPEHRLFAPELGGGALLDVGIYPVSFASMILGQPETIASHVGLVETGVDGHNSLLFGYGGGRSALLSSAVVMQTAVAATVYGTDGYITLAPRFHHTQKLTVFRNNDDTPQVIDVPFEGGGYQFEAQEVHDCLQAGKLESDIMPLDESLAIMQTLDAIRAQWGLVYPQEK